MVVVRGDDLPSRLPHGPRRPATGAAWAGAASPAPAAATAPRRPCPQVGTNPRDDVSAPAPCRSARTARAGALGRGPDHGHRQRLGDRHARRAHQPVHAAGPPARRQARLGDGARHRRDRADRLARPHATHPDVGPGQGDGPARRDRGGAGHDEGLLLRPALTLAATEQRAHQRDAARLLPKGTDLSIHTPTDIALVQVELNQRPRRILDWDSPATRFTTLSATPTVSRR